MSKKNIIAPIALTCVSGNTYASDPTPLFVMFIEAPLIVLGLLVVTLCAFKPKIGIAIGGILLLAQLFVMSWASEVGYMDSAGGWIFTSLAVNFTALIVAVSKLNKAKSNATDT